MLSLDLTHQAKDFLDQLDPKRFRQIVISSKAEIFYIVKIKNTPKFFIMIQHLELAALAAGQRKDC